MFAHMDSCNSATELSKQVNVLHAINWIVQSWKSVSAETKKKCFACYGFKWDDHERESHVQEHIKELQSLIDRANTLGMEGGF